MARVLTRKRVIVALILAVPVMALVLPPLYADGCLYCRCEEINIETGQARISRHVFSVRVSERIDDTPLSLALAGETIHAASVEPWHRVNRFAPCGNTSRHYAFHGALAQARQLDLLCELYELSPEQGKGIAREMLTLWQIDGRDDGVSDFLVRKGQELETLQESVAVQAQ
jgi:hypothetical protein